MKKMISLASIFAVAILAVGCNAEGKVANKKQLDSFDDKLSYAVGMDMAKSLKSIPYPIDMSVVLQAIVDVNAGDSSKILLSDSLLNIVKRDFSKKMMAQQDSVRKSSIEKNLKEGEAFLAANKSKDGIKETASGLQYKVITAGKGTSPGDSATVKVHYTGKLLDGTKFDSSYDRKQPTTFPIYGVIPGWQEALKLMKPGSKWEIWVPSKIAYGERGAGQKVGPNATLHFEVELLEIVPSKK
jgi:FKBP-type peptidyl-prolyl cis-trans isomerase